MEIILTVVITLMVVALIGAGIFLVTLSKKVNEIDLVRNDLEFCNKDLQDRIDGWVSSTDRRFDKLYDEVGRLDDVLNPNKDMVK
jgi:hypothetical protein